MLTENVSDFEATLEATDGQGILKHEDTSALWKILKGAMGFVSAAVIFKSFRILLKVSPGSQVEAKVCSAANAISF